MGVDRKLLPSISMLTAFDAAARTGSASGAARELNVTHGAISRQIHALENQLGVPLFLRTRRGLQLTDVGERYATDVCSVIATLRSASRKIIADPEGCTIDLAVLPAFGTRWLIPRLPGFLAANPDITVNFVTRPTQTAIEEDGIDAAIYNRAPDWPDADSVPLIGECAYPVCSPMLLQRMSARLESPGHRLPLLGLKARPDSWSDWYAAGGMELPEGGNIMQFEQFSALAHAAVAGIGVALLPRFLITSELERGSLAFLSDRATTSETAYYLVTPATRRNYQPVIAFRNWILDTIAQEESAATVTPARSAGMSTKALTLAP